MTTSNTHSVDEAEALALRCEAATGPDRMLDAAIAMSCFVDQDLIDVLPDTNGEAAMTVLRYTASLDAAMVLVPEGWAVESLSAWPATPESADNVSLAQSNVSLVATSMIRMGRRMIWGHGGSDGRAIGRAATPALALCAAALRARATGAA